MFPASDEVLVLKDFAKEIYTYKRLLLLELKYCNDNLEKVLSKARQVYKIGTNERHPLYENCCNFARLEQKCVEYEIKITEDLVAPAKEKQ